MSYGAKKLKEQKLFTFISVKDSIAPAKEGGRG